MQLHHYNEIPEIKEIGNDLYRIELPQPFYAPNNIYIINSGEPTLIDSGYVEHLGLLQRALKKIDLSFRNLKHVIYTHNHIDHISASLSLRHYTNAKMYAMAGLKQEAGDYIQFMKDFSKAMIRLIYKAHQDPAERKKETSRATDGMDYIFTQAGSRGKMNRYLEFDEELVEGDVVDIGGREIGILHTPGHNRWHITPYILGEGIYFTGDLVLQNISAVYAEIDGNLDDYHKTLQRLAGLPIKRLFPAHGPEPESPQRAIRIISKTIALLERGVIRRLQEGRHDLSSLVEAAMGEKVLNSPYYNTALGIIHAIVSRHMAAGNVKVFEIDPPYEQYEWID